METQKTELEILVLELETLCKHEMEKFATNTPSPEYKELQGSR